ncbi:hypothetical protein P4U43_12760, partial [Arthrobacter sp. EH-1B-1]
MNTRSCLLTVGVSALLATGSVLTAAPASAAPGSAECLTAQAALKTHIGVASVDITLANQLRAAIATFESLGAQLEPLYVEADLAVAAELAALEAADAATFEASEVVNAAVALLTAAQSAEATTLAELEAAKQAVLDVPPGDAAALEEAEAQRDQAQARHDIAVAATASAKADEAAAQTALEDAFLRYDEAEQAYVEAFDAAYGTPEILALEAQVETAAASFDDAIVRLSLTEGSNPQDLIALADAVIAACSAAAVAQAPVAHAPVAH